MIDTWWGQVISHMGGELLINNSWSGSRVTRLPESSSLFPSGCGSKRTGGLHTGNILPDVIIVHLGTNDWGYGVPIKRNFISGRRVDVLSAFESAYPRMISDIQKNYPDAEIWCCTLCPTYMETDPSFSFPYSYGGIPMEDYVEVIRRSAEDIGLIDLFAYGISYDSIDGSHPTKKGMNTLASLTIMSMEK